MYHDGWQFSYFIRDIVIFLNQEVGRDDGIKSIKIKNLLLKELAAIHLSSQEWNIVGGNPGNTIGGILLSNGNYSHHFWTTNGNIIIDINGFQYGYDKITILPSSTRTHIPNINKDEVSLETFLYMSTVSALIKKWKKTDPFIYWKDFYLSAPKATDEDINSVVVSP